MKLLEVRTIKEIETCVDMYISLNNFLPTDRKVAISNLSLAVRRKKFVRTLHKSDRIVAWIYADIIHMQHASDKILYQHYYCSILNGILAYRAIEILHSAMYDFAIDNNCDLVISSGSFMDETFVFPRILEKLGWSRKGYMCMRRVQQ